MPRPGGGAGAEFSDDGGKHLEQVIDFLGGVVDTEAEAHAAASAHRIYAHSGENVRWIQRASSAGRAARYANTGLIQHQEDGLRVHGIKFDVNRVGQARLLW